MKPILKVLYQKRVGKYLITLLYKSPEIIEYEFAFYTLVISPKMFDDVSARLRYNWYYFEGAYTFSDKYPDIYNEMKTFLALYGKSS